MNQRSPINYHRRRQLGRTVLHAALYLILAVPAAAALLPLWWVVSTSFKSSGEVVPMVLIPKQLRWDNYVFVFQFAPIGRYMLNSAFIVVMCASGNVISSMLAGYGLARLRWPGREAVFAIVLGTMMLPGVVTLVPEFVMFFKIGWVGTYLPLIVPEWFGVPFYIFLFRQFMRSLPIEIDESARIDGASSWRILVQLITPLSKPAITSVIVFSSIARYNDFMRPLLYVSDKRAFTAQLGLWTFSGSYTDMPVLNYQMTVATVITLPLLILFFSCQRLFVKGVAFTGLAGR